MKIRNRRNRKAINRVLVTSLLAAAIGLAHAHVQAQEATADQHDATHGNSEQPVGDTWITTKVKASMLANQDVPGLDISVETINGRCRCWRHRGRDPRRCEWHRRTWWRGPGWPAVIVVNCKVRSGESSTADPHFHAARRPTK